LEQRCGRALSTLGALFHRGTIENAATVVAERRPLVIVIPQDVYEFDPHEFDALARDVSASLLRVDDGVSEAMLEMLLGPALEAGMQRRQRQGAIFVEVDEPRRSIARRRSWADLEAPPPSSRSSQA
jgi:hypothetical protein